MCRLQRYESLRDKMAVAKSVEEFGPIVEEIKQQCLVSGCILCMNVIIKFVSTNFRILKYFVIHCNF